LGASIGAHDLTPNPAGVPAGSSENKRNNNFEQEIFRRKKHMRQFIHLLPTGARAVSAM
jgi:hypothetical protein